MIHCYGLIIVCSYVYTVLLYNSVLLMGRMLYAVIYIVLMISSSLLFVEATLLTGNLLLAVPLAVLSMALLFADVIIWYRYIHPVVVRNVEMLIAVVFTSFMLLMIPLLLGFLHLAPALVMQATLASTGLIDGWSRVRGLISRSRRTAVRRIREKKGWSRSVPRELEIFVYIDLFTAMLFIPSILLGFYLLVTGVDILVSSLGFVLVMYGLVGIGFHVANLLKPPVEVRIRVLRRKWYTAFLVRHPKIYSFAEKYTNMVKRLLVEAGVFQGPLVFTSRYFVPALLMLVSLGPLGVVAPLLLGRLGFIVLGLVFTVPLILLASPIIYLSSKRGDRRRRVEDELPWFALYASIMQSAGLSLYESFKRLIGKGILPAIENEATIIERNVKMLGMDQVNAIEALARRHPSRRFSEFLYSYTTILRTGGDLVSYLEGRVREYLELLKFRLKRYAERSVDLGEILITMFFILTSIVVSLVIVAGDIALTAIRMYNYLAIPLITIVLYSVINSIQPRLYDRYRVSHALPAITTPLATLIAVVAGWDPPLVIASFVIGLAGGYGFQYYLQQKVISAQERALQDFLRDVAEYRKIGLPVSRAIVSIAERRSYNPFFDDLLSYIAFQLRMHRRLGEVVVPTSSWLVRTVFFILGEIESTGGGTIKVLEELVNFVQEYNIAKNEMRGMLRLYELLAYTTPVMLVLTVSLVTGLSTGFQAPTSSAFSNLPGFSFSIGRLDKTILSEIKTSTLLASISLAVLTSKTIDFTVRNTLRAVIVIIITIASFSFLQPLAEEIIKTLV